MESPAKRMRILQSVQVDEENAEYIMAKQIQQQKLKSRFESIFEKFGNMNESQSDEIDMITNKVVVDRGHLRRIKRQINGKEKGLLDTILLSAGDNLDGDDEEEASKGDSEDELALPQSVKSKTILPPEQDRSRRQVDSTVINLQQYTSPQSDFPATFRPQIAVSQAPTTPNPVANLLPYLQFPQTPAGQEAQSAFYTNLAQALAPLITGHKTPDASRGLVNAAPAPMTPIATNDKMAPATDPKWFFPPLSANPRQFPIAQSSPLSRHAAAPATIDTVRQHTDTISIDMGEERPTIALYTRTGESSPMKPRRSSPRVEIQRRVPRIARKHHFNREDDFYMSKRKRIDSASWAAIKEGREKWKEWPMSALHNRWNLIKDQNLHLQEPPVAPAGDVVNGSDFVSTEEVDAISKPPHHLPTPSSSEHEECHQRPIESTDDILPSKLLSTTHYDDDDRDLLSLAGSDSDSNQLPTGDDNTIEVASQDVIIPSIETRDLVDEDTMLEDLPSTPQTQDFVMTPTRAASIITPTRESSITVKTEPLSSPTALVKRKRSPPLIADVVPESQGCEIEGDVEDDSTNIIVAPHEPARPVTHHQHQQENTSATHVYRRSASLDLIGDDELIAFAPTPTTPSLKRNHEPRTSNQTPKPRHVDVRSESGATKSTSKATRKSFLKSVKRDWTTKGMSGKDSAERKSWGGARVVFATKKRKWVDDDDDDDDDGSEDELTMPRQSLYRSRKE